MRRFDLIPSIAYRDLPDSDEECFIYLEETARGNYTNLFGRVSSSEESSLQKAYITAITNLAAECSITDLSSSNSDPNLPLKQQVSDLMNEVDGLIVRLRIRRSRHQNSDLVRLLPATHTRIEARISLLDQTIRGSTLPAERKDALIKRLDELREELAKPRTSFTKLARNLTAILVVTSQLGADGPETVKNITGGITSILTFIGEDKQKEEEARLRLAPPPPPPQKALPAPSAEATSA